MKNHALISKFIGMWPFEKSLFWWIKNKWKQNGHINIDLGSKILFIIVFENIEERTKVFENQPYFFNNALLFMWLL